MRRVGRVPIGIALGVCLSGGCSGTVEIESDEAKRARIKAMYDGYREAFPEVRAVAVAELEALGGEQGVLLIDVREPKETTVSRIPGAVTREEFEAAAESYRDRTVVTYCTIGYRSGLYADELRQRGFDVLNLEGSILAWTHAGLPLAGETGETKAVHVYGSRWNLAAEGYEAVW